MAADNNPTLYIDKFLSGAGISIITPEQANLPESLQLATQLLDWYMQERDLQAEPRSEMATDELFYDGIQWTEDEEQELRDRNQQPSVINLIKPTIDWITGTEKRVRADWRVMPTTRGGEEDAKVKTHLLKYVVDVNHGEFKKSQAFAQCIKAGLSWREFGVRGDLTDEPIYIGWESWRNILYDSQATDPMFIEDGRYMFRKKVVDLDVAMAMLPARADELRHAAMSTYDRNTDYVNSEIQLYYRPSTIASGVRDALSTHHNRRLVVPLVECWYRKPCKKKKIMGSDKYPLGTEYDPQNDEMTAHIKDDGNDATLYDRVEMQMYVAIFIDFGLEMNRNLNGGTTLLFNAKSPYRHKCFPFVPLWAYRRSDNNTPYGVVRNQRDPQIDFNKRHSKAQFILSTRGVTFEDGAVDDEDELAAEISRPDFMIKVNKDKFLEIHNSNDLAEEHIRIASMDEEYIRQSGGVTGENLGLKTNATSGIAIKSRQQEGGILTQDLFDNSTLHDQVSGEILLSLCEQFMDLPKQIAISGEAGSKFIEINTPSEDGQSLINDITKRAAKFKIAAQDYNSTIRQSMFEELMALLGKLDPQIAMNLLDAVIDLSDIPEKKEIVRRIRQMNGQRDPNDLTEADIKKEDQAKADQQAKDQQQKDAAADALLRKTHADAAAKEAGASDKLAKAFLAALEAAGIMLVVSPQQTALATALVSQGNGSAPAATPASPPMAGAPAADTAAAPITQQ